MTALILILAVLNIVAGILTCVPMIGYCLPMHPRLTNAMRLPLLNPGSIITLLLLLSLPLAAGPVRISFLTEEPALHDTLDLLTNNGCTKKAASEFQRAVQRYVPPTATVAFDFRKFPDSHGGFHHFKSMSELVSALPHQLADTEHAYELNCFGFMFRGAEKLGYTHRFATFNDTRIEPVDILGAEKPRQP